MDRLESMTVFLEVVAIGSLSGAGRKLGMPLATVSRKVTELEAHLKARLLNRSTRQLTLTDAGREYVIACKRIVEDLAEAERVASGEFSAPKGDLVITAPIVFGRLHVLPVIAEFLQAYPEVDVRLLQGDRVVNLIDDHVDVAVRIGALPDSRLSATRVGVTRTAVCASPDYFAARGTPATPLDLTAHRCITFEALMAAHAWSFDMNGREVSVPIRSRLIVNTAEAAIDAALAGVGITRVLCYQFEQARRAASLQLALQPFEPATLPISLVYNSQKRLPLKLRAFLDFAAPRLRERMSTDIT
jgi:DNA-binding transcriptional LysR family regulator